MVEAGWKYAPLVDADDNVICPYCDCGLYGWEQEDEPWSVSLFALRVVGILFG